LAENDRLTESRAIAAFTSRGNDSNHAAYWSAAATYMPSSRVMPRSLVATSSTT
jgi:hypothetical protein